MTQRNNRRHLSFEPLESRLLLAVLWNGEGANENWNTGGNWAGGSAPPAAETAQFNDMAPRNSVEIGAEEVDIGAIVFQGETQIDLKTHKLDVAGDVTVGNAAMDVRAFVSSEDPTGEWEIGGKLSLGVADGQLGELYVEENTSVVVEMDSVVAEAGAGFLYIGNGGRMEFTNDLSIGTIAGHNGSVVVTGTNMAGTERSQLRLRGSLNVGEKGDFAQLEAKAKGEVRVQGDIHLEGDVSGITISGEGRVGAIGKLLIGRTTSGTARIVTVNANSVLETAGGSVGNDLQPLDDRNVVLVDGAGAVWDAESHIIHVYDNGEVPLENGGKVLGKLIRTRTAINGEGGMIGGNGTFVADIDNQGRTRPGHGDAVGMLIVDGGYSQSGLGRLDIEIKGAIAGTDYDVLQVSDANGDGSGGAVTLGGTLDVDLINNFTAEQASSYEFTILTASESLTGSFNYINDDLPDGWTWDVLYDRTTGDGDGMDVVLKINKPDVEAAGFGNDSYGGLVVDYEIHSADTGYVADPFSIGIYQSSDGVTPEGSALQTANVTSSGDLTPGVHSISISPSFYSAWESHYLMAVVDSGDVIDESNESNNDAVFRGAFLANGVLSIHGDDTANTIEITDDGATYHVDIDDEVVLAIAKSKVNSVYVQGHDGGDTIKGAAVDKFFAAWGAAGDDTINGGTYTNYLFGGDDHDTLTGGGETDSAYGGDGNDYLYGYGGNDYLYGEGGDDQLYGGAGDDHLYGHAGGDTMYGGDDRDTMYGGDEGDYLYGEAGIDTMYGGGDGDYLYGGDEADYLFGEGGGDTIYGGAGSDTLHGGDGDDVLYGGFDADTLYGHGGNDFLAGEDGIDYHDGGDGNDIIDASLNDFLGYGDYLFGGYGDDHLTGGSGNDYLDGGDGDDSMYGGDGDDFMYGGEGNDYMEGQNGDDIMFGEEGDDEMYGGYGDDYLDGGPGDDFLDGGGQLGDIVLQRPECDVLPGNCPPLPVP